MAKIIYENFSLPKLNSKRAINEAKMTNKEWTNSTGDSYKYLRGVINILKDNLEHTFHIDSSQAHKYTFNEFKTADILNKDELKTQLEKIFINFDSITDEKFLLNGNINVPLVHLSKSNELKKLVGARANSTAVSNINECLTVFLVMNSKLKLNEDTLLKYLTENVNEDSNVLVDNKKFSNQDLFDLLTHPDISTNMLIDNIKIALNNKNAIENDIDISKIRFGYWTPRIKPNNINPKNPSDIIFNDGSFFGYSLKGGIGAEKAPLFNSTIGKILEFDTILGSKFILESKEKFLSLLNKYDNKLYNELKDEIDSVEMFTENSIATSNIFAKIERKIGKEKLDELYHDYRNYAIDFIINSISKFDNLYKFFRYIGYSYVFQDINTEIPCLYKLLIGQVKGSTIREVSNNELLKEILLDLNKNKIKKLNIEHNMFRGKLSQTFTIEFIYNNKYEIIFPFIIRSRYGFKGLNLFMSCNSFGIKEL